MKKNFIYCYTNNFNNKKYVGQTNCLDRRKREHKSNAQNKNSQEYNLLFHKKLREYGEDNFTFSVLEEIIDKDQDFVNEREIYWIKEMNSYVETGCGYNLTLGGDNIEHLTIYSKEDIEQVKKLILERKTYSEISKITGMSSGYISGINTGLYFHDDNLEYPLVKYYQTEEELREIINLLENTTIPMTKIAKMMGKAYSTIKKINYGSLHHGFCSEYPVRKVAAPAATANIVKEMLLNKYSDKEIIEKTRVSRQTIKRINTGETRYDKNLNYPLR